MALIRKIKDGDTTIYPITVDQAVFVGEDGTTLDEALNNKADKAEYSLTPVRVDTWIDGNPVWRVAIPMTSVSEIGLDTYNKAWLTSADGILSRLSIVNDTSNFIYINSMICFQNADDYDLQAFAVDWTEPFPGVFLGKATDSDYATHFYGWIEFVAPSNNISTS